MKTTLFTLGAATALSLLMSSTAFAQMTHTYEFTITNTMETELIAPVVVASTDHDGDIFDGDYVTPEAEVQVLTGDPAQLVARIDHGATVATGTDGPPGVLLAPGKSITFTVTTDAEKVRVFAMVAPTEVPDNYLTAVIDLAAGPMAHDDAMGDDAMADDAMGDDAMKDDAMADDAMGDDAMKDDAMADDAMGDDAMKDDAMADDAMGDDAMKDDAMADDAMADDAMGDHSDRPIVADFARFDIGNDEGTKVTTPVEGMGFGSIVVREVM